MLVPSGKRHRPVMREQARRYSGADPIYHDVPPALAEQARRNARGP